VFSGEIISYAVTVTNPDSGVTFPAFYENSFTAPGEDWMISWDTVPKSILIDPGAIEVISTLRVISPIDATPGISNIDLQLTEETGSSGFARGRPFGHRCRGPVDSQLEPSRRQHLGRGL